MFDICTKMNTNMSNMVYYGRSPTQSLLSQRNAGLNGTLAKKFQSTSPLSGVQHGALRVDNSLVLRCNLSCYCCTLHSNTWLRCIKNTHCSILPDYRLESGDTCCYMTEFPIWDQLSIILCIKKKVYWMVPPSGSMPWISLTLGAWRYSDRMV